MFDFYKRSLRNKLFIAFLGIGILPFITLLLYIIFLSETKLVHKIVLQQEQQSKVVVNLIENHLKGLQKEVRFLSSLDLMDDLLSDDVDKRISRLLKKKADDLALQLEFFVLGMDNTIIASSNKSALLEKFLLKKNNKDYYIKNNHLYIYAPIAASFDPSTEIGTLVLAYSLENLQQFLTHTKTNNAYLINPKTHYAIGEKLPLQIDIEILKTSNIYENYIVVSQELHDFLQGWYLIYAIDKDIAMESLNDFIDFMLLVALFILLLIIFVSLKYSNEIVKPIAQLTSITDTITQTKKYDTQLHVDSQDEIALLADSFNTMIQTTSKALHTLQEENKLRLQRFTQLIDIFNHIITTETEEECINVSIEEIQKLTHNSIRFVKEKSSTAKEESMDLNVTDFENDTTIYFGTILFSIETFADSYEENFYNSIVSMISLQLDRIRLIKRTMSASRAKSAFISNMSHELRTPLNAIIGFAQFMIEYEELSADQKETIQNIESSAQYLLNMINDILDIAKIEAGKMEAHLEPVKVAEILQNAYNMLLPLAQQKGIALQASIEDVEDLSIQTDPKMFQQILLNLLSNALKFTQEGSVTLEASRHEKKLLIRVIDSGIGISQENLKNLFEEFSQVENVMQKKHKGTGLGLTISKKMATILGGDVILESQGEGKGTIALFFIPLNA